jgi:hypothetical protein
VASPGRGFEGDEAIHCWLILLACSPVSSCGFRIQQALFGLSMNNSMDVKVLCRRLDKEPHIAS